MATGSQVLNAARAALGASEGAATTPTRYLYVPSDALDLSGLQQRQTIEDRPGWNRRDQLRALYNGIEDNTVAITGMPVSYEDLGFYLSTVPGIVSGSGQGAGTPTTTDTSAYTRAFLASQTVTTVGAGGGYDLHLQAGPTDLTSTVNWSVPGLRCTDLTLAFKKRASGTDSGAMLSGTWQTPKAATQITSLTGSPADRTQTLPTGNVVKAFVDSSTLGSTADPEVTEATLQVTCQPAFHDGQDATGLHTSMHFPNPMASQMTLVRKFSDTTELAAYLARTRRRIRILLEGAVIGATTAKNTIQVDFVGDPSTHQMTWVDGMLYASIVYLGVWDSTLAASWKVTTISTVSAAYTTT